MRIHQTACAALLAAASLLVSRAASVSPDDRFKTLEERVSALESENASLRRLLSADTKPAGPVGVVAQGRGTGLALGGFVQVHGEMGDAPDARFPATNRVLMRRARLGLKGNFAENVNFVLQTDLGNNSLNSTSGFRAQLTDAFLVWNKYPFATVTAGQFKVPYGYEQLLADAKILTIERSLPNDNLTLPRQAGAMVSGYIWDRSITYAVAAGNGNGTNISYNDNDQFDYIGRLAATLIDRKPLKITLGANTYTSYDTGTFTGRRTGRAFDAEFFYGPFEVDGEVLRTHFNRDVGTDYDADGWCVTGAYMFVPNRWQALVRVERYDPNKSIGSDATTVRTIGINYFLKGDDLKLSLNYLIGNPPATTRHQDRLIGRLQVVF